MPTIVRTSVIPACTGRNFVDYAIVLMGELVAIMDEDETVMRAGDILVQRGTNHAWANRSGRMCRIAFILIDGKR